MAQNGSKKFTLNPFVLWRDLKGAFLMFSAVIRGRYPPPVRSIIWAVLGLLYFILPFDLIPESVFLFLGLGDDLLVLAYVLNKIRPDVEAYKKFSEGQKKGKR